ncbi:MAG: NAD(P)-binding domain-containing protein, partial [Candidatus Marinimicrobia bacterium]|nr:NAD(P)-binding domain-containing protein [Candidatus Neomarinimicrobiota bacterium]
MKSNVGFIGLGVMGRHMAGHLLAAGHAVRVFTRTASKARELLERGALWEATPGGLAAQSEVVITMIGTPRDVEEVYFGSDGILAAMRPGPRLIDITTSTPEFAVRIAAAATERGGAALDAPVSGGERGAGEATLSIMVGG